MFNFQGSELIIILLLALVVLGPEKLPEAMRRLGQFYAELKKMSTSFQEEFRAVVDEPMRELRDTANTLRDSADFRKFADGERNEKPKSAEMPPADPSVTPTDDVPFRPEPSDEAEAASSSAAERPAPFSSSQTISAAAPRVEPTPSGPDPEPEPLAPQVAIEDEDGLREARPVQSSLAPQVAIEDEDGLREARPVQSDGAHEDGAA